MATELELKLATLIDHQHDPSLIHGDRGEHIRQAIAEFDPWSSPNAILWGITDPTRPFSSITDPKARQWIFQLITSQLHDFPNELLGDPFESIRDFLFTYPTLTDIPSVIVVATAQGTFAALAFQFQRWPAVFDDTIGSATFPPSYRYPFLIAFSAVFAEVTPGNLDRVRAARVQSRESLQPAILGLLIPPVIAATPNGSAALALAEFAKWGDLLDWVDEVMAHFQGGITTADTCSSYFALLTSLIVRNRLNPIDLGIAANFETWIYEPYQQFTTTRPDTAKFGLLWTWSTRLLSRCGAFEIFTNGPDHANLCRMIQMVVLPLAQNADTVVDVFNYLSVLTFFSPETTFSVFTAVVDLLERALPLLPFAVPDGCVARACRVFAAAASAAPAQFLGNEFLGAQFGSFVPHENPYRLTAILAAVYYAMRSLPPAQPGQRAWLTTVGQELLETAKFCLDVSEPDPRIYYTLYYLFSIAGEYFKLMCTAPPSAQTAALQPLIVQYFCSLVSFAAKVELGLDWCSSFGKIALFALRRDQFKSWVTPEVLPQLIDLCLRSQVPELQRCVGYLAERIPEQDRAHWLTQTIDANRNDAPLVLGIMSGSKVPAALQNPWLELLTAALRVEDDAIVAAAMRAIRVFGWSDAAAHVFLTDLVAAIGPQDAPRRLPLTQVLQNTTEILKATNTEMMGRVSAMLKPGNDWQLYVLQVGVQAIAAAAQNLRVLVQRTRRDGEFGELHREVIPLYIAFFNLAQELARTKLSEIGELIGIIVETTTNTLTLAFDVPEIVEVAIAALTQCITAHGAAMLQETALIWLPISIVLAPDFSPSDRRWIGAIGALLKYHYSFDRAQTQAFGNALETVIGQFTDPSWVGRYRDLIHDQNLSQIFMAAQITIVPQFAVLFIELHVQAQAASWTPP